MQTNDPYQFHEHNFRGQLTYPESLVKMTDLFIVNYGLLETALGYFSLKTKPFSLRSFFYSHFLKTIVGIGEISTRRNEHLS